MPGGRRYPSLRDRGRDRRGGAVHHGLPRLVRVQRVVDRVGIPRGGRHAACEMWRVNSNLNSTSRSSPKFINYKGQSNKA